jgi:DtxR family transcriptional regulator, Mn-dependent transcriptional regulator
MDAELSKSDLTQSERETLKAIYRATRDAPDAHTGVLADALGVAPGTVTATVKKLADRGLVDHKPYRGVELTEAGRSRAM